MPRSALAALVVAFALPPAAAAQAPDTTHPQFTVSASHGAASLANISTGRPIQRPGAHLSLMVGAAISPRLTIRLDATAASVRTLSVLQMAGGFDDTTRVDSLPPAAAMLGASLSIEATPWASMPLRLRAGPAYLYAESPEAAPPRPVPGGLEVRFR